VTLENATLVGIASKEAKAGGAKKNIQLANEPLSIEAKLQTYRYMEEASVPAAGGQKQQQKAGAGQK
jgi:hypothetical protein